MLGKWYYWENCFFFFKVIVLGKVILGSLNKVEIVLLDRIYIIIIFCGNIILVILVGTEFIKGCWLVYYCFRKVWNLYRKV